MNHPTPSTDSTRNLSRVVLISLLLVGCLVWGAFQFWAGRWLSGVPAGRILSACVILLLVGITWSRASLLNQLAEEREHAARAVRDANARYQCLATSTAHILWTTTPQGEAQDMLGWRRFTGQTIDEVQRDGWLNAVHPDDRRRTLQTRNNALECRSSHQIECRIRRNDGSYRHAILRGVPVPSDDGLIREWIFTCSDVHETKQSQLTEARLAAVVESSNDAIISKTMQGIVMTWNRSAEALFGYSPEEMIGQPITRLVPPELIQEEDWIIARVGRGELVNHYDTVRVRKDGRRVEISLTISPIRSADGTIIGASKIARDITQRRQAEDQMRAKEARLRLATQVAGIGAFEWNLRTGKNSWTPELEAMYGLRTGEFEGTQPAWESFVHPQDRGTAIASVQRAFDTRHPQEAEWRVVWPDGTIRWIAGRFQVTLDENGRSLSLAGVNIDITDRKLAEQQIRMLNAELEARVRERTAQLEAANRELEAFTYSVSHDLRAPVRALQGFTEVLLEEHAEVLEGDGKRLLHVIRGEASRMGQLIDDLLAFSKLGRQSLRPAPLDMTSQVNSVLVSFEREIREKHVQVQLGDLPRVQADASMLRQVWINLISNAIKFTGHREKPVIQISGQSERDGVVYSIQDNGVGFDMDYAHNLFGVFQRLHTQDEFEGNGVGLALVQRIIERHGGQISAEAKPGEGATFRFKLPNSPVPPA